MKKIMNIVFLLMLSANLLPASLRVVGAYPGITAIVTVIGGSDVQTECLADGRYDPHVITPKPSLIVRLHQADLLVINGAQLEIGWLPPLLNQAGNSRLHPGQPGFLDLSIYVQLIDVPASVSREQGDVHPDGNPHFLLDPENILTVARAIAERLARLDPAHEAGYRERLEHFTAQWREHMSGWAEKLKPLAGKQVIAYHRLFDYLLRRYGMQLIATIEPLPGIAPSSRHLARLVEFVHGGGVDLILQDVYHSSKAANYLAGESGLRLVTLPHDVNASSGTKDIFAWFDEIVRRLQP